MAEFIFDIIISIQYTAAEEERLKKEFEEKRKGNSFTGYDYYRRYYHTYTLCQVKITPTDGSVVTAMDNAKYICDEIIANNKDNNFYSTNENMEYEVKPKLSKFVENEITTYTVAG
jgi:hypothetical protein